MMFFFMTSDTMNVGEMRDYADNYVIQRLSRLEGVAKVEEFGSPYAIKIKLHPELLAARNITLQDVLAAIKGRMCTSLREPSPLAAVC